MIAKKTARITTLDSSAFSERDTINLILQRSEIIQDQPRPGRYIRSWTQGDTAPLTKLIARLGTHELVKRAAAFILLEYLELKPLFDEKPPRNIADIGCGYALFNLFLAQDFGSDLVLIDLEHNEHKHFGFKREGAAYSNLDVARRFLVDNGIKDSSITTINPKEADLNDVHDLDYAFSFISCGFHYPWTAYQFLFEKVVDADGTVILDIRRGKSPAAREEMSVLGQVDILGKAGNGSADRVLLKQSLAQVAARDFGSDFASRDFSTAA